VSFAAVFEDVAELDAEVDADAEDDALADGLVVAAWATAVPPPTSAPLTMTAIAAFLIVCRMSFTSFRVISVQSSRAT
jgi:hypothetical protein